MFAFDVFVVSMEGGTIGETDFRLGYVVAIAVVFLAYRGNPVFTYDSDGEVIILDSKNPSLNFLICPSADIIIPFTMLCFIDTFLIDEKKSSPFDNITNIKLSSSLLSIQI